MSTGLHELRRAQYAQRGDSENGEQGAVDIVAVHGLNEDLIGAWTHPDSGTLWLRDLLPQTIPVARVLTYGYHSSSASFFNTRYGDAIQKHAHTLVASLQSDRSLEGCDHRPIIFVCHGLGGLIVKKALAYSASRTSSQVQHLYTIFISTYGILFFGTPHGRLNIATWLALESTSSHSDLPNERTSSVLDNDLGTLQTITDQFAPLMKQFHIFFFWEEIPSAVRGKKIFIVEENSAAPTIDNTERAGISATHSTMVKFAALTSSNYRLVIAALARYCRDCPPVIARRWKVALYELARARSNEASELVGLGFGVHDDSLFYYDNRTMEKSRNRHCITPPETSTDFIGRESESDTLEQALISKEINPLGRKQKRFVVYGMSGSGKTELCAHFAREHKEEYWGVFTIRAKYTETIKDSFAEIGKLGGLEATESAGKHWLSQSTEPWLLIIDNADDPELHLENLFPYGDKGHILITTRNRYFRTYGNAGSIELKGLEEKDALNLLLKRAEIPSPWDISTENAGRQISKALGYLALALVQAGTHIVWKMCDLKDYLNFHNIYRRKRHARSRSISGETSKTDTDIVYSAFDTSLGFLESKNTVISQDAVELLNIISFYHFEHIRVDIFTRAIENRRKALAASIPNSTSSRMVNMVIKRLNPPQMLPQFLKEDPELLEPYRIREALHELTALSLIHYDGKNASFSLHPLVHAWARDRLSKGEKDLWSQIAFNTLAESVLLPPEDRGESHTEYRKDLLPHLEECLKSCQVKIESFSGLFGKIHIYFAKVFQPTLLMTIRGQTVNAAKCGYVFAERGRFAEGAMYLSRVTDTLVRVLGYEHERTTLAMLALAGVFWGIGRLEEAIALQTRVVEARTKVLGSNHRDTLLAMDQLGKSFWVYGQYSEALSIQETTTERMKKTLGQDHSDTLAALDNLAVTLGSWHRYQESMEIHKEVLSIREKRLGKTDLETITTASNLAMALIDLDRAEEAKTIMQEVVAQRKLQLGKEHPWTLWAMCNLAKADVELGNLDEAEILLLEGIPAAKRSLGDDHHGVLMGCAELARTYARQGRLSEAEFLALDTMGRIEKHRGREHPDFIYFSFKIAQLYEQEGKLEQAIAACRTALDGPSKRLTSQHPLYKIIQNYLEDLERRHSSHEEDYERPDPLDDQQLPSRFRRPPYFTHTS